MSPAARRYLREEVRCSAFDQCRGCASPACLALGRCAFPRAVITLPFPASSLSGHAKGHWRSKSGPTAEHREWARLATLAASLRVPASGDIRLHIRFVPPDRRGDRTNYPNRLKPYFDGIADALGVNDSRFHPSYEFAEPAKPGRVEITVRGLA